MNLTAYLANTGMTYYKGHVNIDKLILDLLAMEDHIANGANKDSNRVRVTLIRQRVETALAAISISSDYSGTLVTSDYLDLLRHFSNCEMHILPIQRIVSSIQPVETLQTLMEVYSQHKDALTKINFGVMSQVFVAAAKNSAHIVMKLDIYPTEVILPKSEDDFTQAFISAHAEEDVVTRVSSGQARDIRTDSVMNSISDASKGQTTSLSLGDWKHSEITETLRQGVYGGESTSPVHVPIIYSDGSEARPFPFACLSEQDYTVINDLAEKPALKMGLMSGRHPEMDNQVSGYWLQNIAISQHRRTLAEADEAAYCASKARFAQMKGHEWNLWIAQTGYPPSVVGFLRALVEELLERRNDRVRLYLVPQYYDWDGKSRQMIYKPGTPWF